MVEALEAALTREGLETVSAVDGASALQSFHRARPDAVLLAVVLGDESGVEVCQALRDAPRGQLVPILFMGEVDERSPVRSPGEALSHGGDYFFPLPNDLDYLAGRVRGWTTDVEHDREPATAPLPIAEELPSIEMSDFLEFDQESVTEHDYSPIPPILRVKGGADRTGEDAALSLVHQGESLRASGRLRESIEIYAAAAAMYETDDAVGPALALYKLILHLDSGEFEIARHAGRLAARVGRNQDALEIYRRTADALEARGQLDNAMFLIHEMIRLRPEDTALRRRLQELELALGLERAGDRDASFDDLIAKEIGKSWRVNTLDMVTLPPEPESLDGEEIDLLSHDTVHVPPVRGVASDLEVPVLPRPEAPTDLLAPDTEDPDELARPDVTDRLPVPEPVEEVPPVPEASFEVAPLTMGGWSRLPVWDDLSVPAEAQRLRDLLPPSYGAASRITPARFVPVEGVTTSLVDMVRLLARIEEQRATGILAATGAPRIVFVDGQPAALRGHRAVHGFLSLLLAVGKVDEAACRDLMSFEHSERPVDVARMFVRHGFLRETEGTVYLHRHFEDGLTALLRQHGSYELDGSEEVEVVREEIVPELDDVRRLLIDLLPRVAGQEELLDAVGGEGARIRVTAMAEVGPSRDARFLAILDGRYELAEAARLSAIPLERAAAVAFVYVLFGLATVVQRPKARSALSWIPLSQPTGGEPILSSPPKRQKPTPIDHSVDRRLDPPSRLRALARLVRANDYFTILGVTPTSAPDEVRAAHRRLTELIDTDVISVDPDLVELAREIRRSLDEARDVLADPTLKAAYQQHLKP